MRFWVPVFEQGIYKESLGWLQYGLLVVKWIKMSLDYIGIPISKGDILTSHIIGYKQIV